MNINYKETFDKAFSYHHSEVEYKVGEKVTVEEFNEDPSEECTDGIHFFFNIDDLKQYVYDNLHVKEPSCLKKTLDRIIRKNLEERP